MQNSKSTVVALPTIFIGDAERQEFRNTAEALQSRGAPVARDIQSALTMINGGFVPGLIFVCHPWPNSYSADEVDALRRAAPLARIVRLLGSCMEGELRTGRPWPATLRRYWYEVEPEIGMHDSEFRIQPALSVPPTASEDEQLLQKCYRDDKSISENPVRIAIFARYREAAESLTDVCAQRGWSATWQRDIAGGIPAEADVALYDAICGNDADLHTVSNLTAALDSAPLIAILGFPRTFDASRFKSAGAAAVISKPFQAGDLIWQIEKCLTQAVPRAG